MMAVHTFGCGSVCAAGACAVYAEHCRSSLLACSCAEKVREEMNNGQHAHSLQLSLIASHVTTKDKTRLTELRHG